MSFDLNETTTVTRKASSLQLEQIGYDILVPDCEMAASNLPLQQHYDLALQAAVNNLRTFVLKEDEIVEQRWIGYAQGRND